MSFDVNQLGSPDGNRSVADANRYECRLSPSFVFAAKPPADPKNTRFDASPLSLLESFPLRLADEELVEEELPERLALLLAADVDVAGVDPDAGDGELEDK